MKCRLPLLAALFAAGCAPAGPLATVPASTPQPSPTTPVAVRALPGGLDATPVFNSDRPETLSTDGILLSLFDGDPSIHLDDRFTGDFGFFSHHVAHMADGNPRPLHVGLLARNRTSSPVTLRRTLGARALTRPDAPFITLPGLTVDPNGQTFAGPGDLVATTLIHGRNTLPAQSYTLAPNQTMLIDQLPVPVTVNGAPGANGVSTIAHYTSSGEVSLAEVARFATDDAGPTEAEFLAVLNANKLAGPPDSEATPYDPALPAPAGAFRYGRVSGVSMGERWTGTLFNASSPTPAVGQAVGFPIAGLYLNTLGTKQNQSASVRKRQPGSAYQSHGNYGVTYALSLPLDNPDSAPRRYRLAFTHPLRVNEANPGPIAYAAGNTQVTFRGPLRLQWQDAQGVSQDRYYHVVLHTGENAAPFEAIEVPAGGHVNATFTLIYPADCTPPQLLVVSCEAAK